MVWDEIEAYALSLETDERRVTRVFCDLDNPPELYHGRYGNAPVEKGAFAVVTHDGERHYGE